MTYHPFYSKNHTVDQEKFDSGTLIVMALSYFRILILFLGLYVPLNTAFGQDADFLSQGNAAFVDQKYETALQYYRQHLRANPNDAKTWNLVAATHYHLGQPRRALQFLKRFRSQANPRSHNLFYQGLAYDAIGQTASAIRYLTEASKYQDPFGALASYELIAILGEARQTQEALNWVEYYQKRFADGPHKNKLDEIKSQLERGNAVNLTDSQRHQYRLGLYRNHPWSLVDTPHFWLLQIGYYYARGLRTDPAIGLDRRPTVDENKPFEDTALQVRAAFGLGPYHNKETKIYLAYYYLQDWTTTRDRLKTYIEEPLDISYFPLRPDLQVRTHRLLADLYSKLTPGWSLGLYSHLEFVRAGSRIYPAPERPEIRKTLNVSYSTKLTPWISWNFMKKQELLLYTVFEKTINQEQSDFSNQNFRLFDDRNPFISVALAYEGQFLRDQLSVRTDLYRFKYQFNDYWEGFTRTGLFVKSNYRLSPRLSLMGRLGIYNDKFTFDQIKTNTCDFDTQLGGLSDRGVTCSRVDQGSLIQGAAIYQPKPYYAWMGSVYYLNHENQQLKVYNENKVEFLLSFSWGFPKLRDTLGILNRFTETSLDYEGF